MKRFLIPVAALAASSANPASAVTIIATNGSTALPSYTTANIFQTFGTSTLNGGTFVPNSTVTSQSGIPAVTETANSATVKTYFSNVSGEANGGGVVDGTYLSILAFGSYTISFAQPVHFFSYVLSSLDSYNFVQLDTTSGKIKLQGSQITGTSGAFSGRVSYDFGGATGLKSITFLSTDNSMEIDSIAAAAPEPATWGMMILGFGVAGAALRRRRSALAASI
jgi:PEP-CTERM motif